MTTTELLLKGLVDEKGIVLTKDIAEEFNKTRLDRERWKTSSIGYLIRELGFNKIHKEQGSAWLIKQDRLQYWQQIYQIEVEGGIPTSGSVQSVQTIQPSIKMPDNGLEPYFNQCYFCGDPILENDWVTNEFTENKPAHKCCYEKKFGELKR